MPAKPSHRELDLRLEARQCVACAACSDVCPTGALPMTAEDLAPAWLLARCTGCGLCERQCPTGAIRVRVGKVQTGGAPAGVSS